MNLVPDIKEIDVKSYTGYMLALFDCINNYETTIDTISRFVQLHSYLILAFMMYFSENVTFVEEETIINIFLPSMKNNFISKLYYAVMYSYILQ